MAEYRVITSTRTTPPDVAALVAALRSSIAPDVGVQMIDTHTYNLKKSTAWSSADTAAAQGLIDAAADLTPQRAAQNEIDNLPLALKALALTVLDEVNILRAQHSLPARTTVQLITAMRNKAGTL